LHCQGKISFSFNGYDDDPRECFEVEEMRRFVALLDEAVPELFFFAQAEEPAHTLKLFLFCLGGIEWESERSTFGTPRRTRAERACTVDPIRTVGAAIAGS
jgi:hypothetical protein